jgi:hypothetical protein
VTAAQQSTNFVVEGPLGPFAAWWLSYSLAVGKIILVRNAARLTMDSFEKKRFLPIEVMIALAINVVVAILGYYAIMMWGIFGG